MQDPVEEVYEQKTEELPSPSLNLHPIKPSTNYLVLPFVSVETKERDGSSKDTVFFRDTKRDCDPGKYGLPPLRTMLKDGKEVW